jgi:hypothetical protein
VDAGLVADGTYGVYIEVTPIDDSTPINITAIMLEPNGFGYNEDDGTILRVNLGVVTIRNGIFTDIRRPFPNIMLPVTAAIYETLRVVTDVSYDGSGHVTGLTQKDLVIRGGVICEINSV